MTFPVKYLLNFCSIKIFKDILKLNIFAPFLLSLISYFWSQCVFVFFFFASGADDVIEPLELSGGQTTFKYPPPKSPTRNKRRSRTTSTSSPSESNVVRSGTRTIYTAGRPPWYDTQGQLKEAFVIG